MNPLDERDDKYETWTDLDLCRALNARRLESYGGRSDAIKTLRESDAKWENYRA